MFKNPLKYIVLILIFFCSGLVPNGVVAAPRDTQRRGEGISPSQSSFENSESHSKRPAAEEPVGSISLGKALALSLMKNPELSAYSWEVRAAEARVIQAGLLPNPEFEFEAEELGWSDERNGVGSAVMYFTLSQLLELGGKRRKRTNVAALETDIEGWEYKAKRLDVFAETTKAFIRVLGAQNRVALSEKFNQLAKRVLQVVSDRVEAGKVSPLEKTKAQVSVAMTRIELERARRLLKAARKRLASTWGSTSPEFREVMGEIEAVSGIPNLDSLLEKTFHNPDLAKWETATLLSQAKLDFEKSKRIPNVTVRAGLQRFEETNDNAFVFALTIPLPIFDRNQGGIEEALHNIHKVVEEKKMADVRIKTELSYVYQVLSASYLEAVTLKNDILPAAKRVFDGLSQGYRQGKFAYLDVLDSQRTLFDSQAKYIDALATYHEASVEVGRLIGQHRYEEEETQERNRDGEKR
ncbi:MAG: TolC family protein [Desulfobacteraceae bacterium]|nr:TolC family protein [Desulfobacteraceae bacterium]